MQAGDEGKPMSIMEFISDQPRDAVPFIDYIVKWLKEYSEANWPQSREEERVPAACVRIQIDSWIGTMEDINRKLEREREEQLAVIHQPDTTLRESKLPIMTTLTPKVYPRHGSGYFSFYDVKEVDALVAKLEAQYQQDAARIAALEAKLESLRGKPGEPVTIESTIMSWQERAWNAEAQVAADAARIAELEAALDETVAFKDHCLQQAADAKVLLHNDRQESRSKAVADAALLAGLRQELAIVRGDLVAADVERKNLAAEIDSAWWYIEHGYDIETRQECEVEFLKGAGWKSPLELAMHLIWKRNPKVADLTAQLALVTQEKETPNTDPLTVACPRCHVPPGQRCMSPAGVLGATYHLERVRQTRSDQEREL